MGTESGPQQQPGEYTADISPLEHDHTSRIAFSWLLKLRWGAIICQLVLILAVSLLFDINVPVGILLLFFSFQISSNIYFVYLHRRHKVIGQDLFGLVMTFDVIHLTLLLYFTGGPMNPFTFLYLVHVTLAAILMQPSWAWGIAAMTIAAYATIFSLPEASLLLHSGQPPAPICVDLEHTVYSPTFMSLHLQGMWLAYSITALFIVFFIGKIQKALGEHRAIIDRLQKEKQQSDKLASLATLAAGAAHEFSTPLSTIAVAAGEMVYLLQKEPCAPDLLADAKLIRGQVQKCKEILSQLSADAGDHLGEPFEDITVTELIEAVLYELAEESRAQVDVSIRSGELLLHLPINTFIRSLKGLLKNAYDAGKDTNIRLECFSAENYLHIRVSDQGQGMDSETLTRACDPFFTTKGPGSGLGLGLFLARSIAERFGGGVAIASRPGHGATVDFQVALDKIRAEEHGTKAC